MKTALVFKPYSIEFLKARTPSRKNSLRVMVSAKRRAERELRPPLGEWLADIRKEVVGNINKRFAKSQIDTVVTELADWELIEEDGIITIKPAILRAIAIGGEQAHKLLEIQARFDLLNPRSVEFAQKITADLVVEVAGETRDAIRNIIADGIQEGRGIPQIARQIRPRVGLTERQMRAAANFEEKLLIERPDLSRREVNRRVRSYEKKLHRRRAETIARTETSRAVSEGNLVAYEESGVVDEVEWLTASGCCDKCDAMNGQRVSLRVAHGMQPLHPNCVCTWLPVVI